MAIAPPIIVADGLDVLLFRSADVAELGVEARDVTAGVYRVWDGAGRPLRFAAESGASSTSSALASRSARPAPRRPTTLGSGRCWPSTSEYLAALSVEVAPGASLPALLDATVARAAYAR